MKRLFATALLALSSIAFGATTVPVQLLNPTGSTSGQAVLSTGASSAPNWGTITVPIATGVTGLGTGVATGLAAAATGSGGPVLATSPTITTPGITGVTSGSGGAAGQLGELQLASANAVNITTSATSQNCTSKLLTAGDWLVFGQIQFAQGSGGFTPTQILASLSTTSATLQVPSIALGVTFTPNFSQALALPMIALTVTTSTTVFVVGQATYSSGTPTFSCTLTAIRFH